MTVTATARPDRDPLRILLLADDQKGHAGTIHDHIQAFVRHSRHAVTLFNPRGLDRSRVVDFDAFDVVVIHYSLIIISDAYLPPWFRDQIARFPGLKVQFLQDEYRWVDAVTSMMRNLGIDVLFSVVPPASVKAIYGTRLPDTEVVLTLTGYVSDDLRKASRHVPERSARPIDVGYRGRSVPFWLGRLGHEKVEIGRRFLREVAGTGLRCDIEWTERERIYGGRWLRFVSSCRATLASESGSSIVDFDGSAERSIQTYLKTHPLAEYEDVERDVLGARLDGVSINAISPRIFEAGALRTALVMFPGEYSDVVQPEEHYIVLEKDFSNIDSVVAQLRDDTSLDAMVERAYRDLIESGRFSFRSFVAEFDEVVERRAPRTRRRPQGRVPTRVALRSEELAAGSAYLTSSLYGLARRLVVVSLGSWYVLRTGPQRRLARAVAASSDRGRWIWHDLFRLGIATKAHEDAGAAGAPGFDIEPTFDDGCLMLTSTNGALAPPPDDDLERRVRDALTSGRLNEIVWNHTAVGQFIRFALPPTRRHMHFDIGQYDSYGIYRFHSLVEFGRRRPTLVMDVLAPLLSPVDSRARGGG